MSQNFAVDDFICVKNTYQFTKDFAENYNEDIVMKLQRNVFEIDI